MRCHVKFFPETRSARLYIGSIIVIDLLLVWATLVRADFRTAHGVLRWLTTLDLTRENNCATWWSGMMLFLAGLHALDGYYLFRADRRAVSRAWASLSAVLILLSADELGSVHERMQGTFHLGRIGSLLPWALVLVALLAPALTCLYREPDQRARIAAVVLGLGCFGLVVFLEVLEHLVSWEGWLVAIRGATEEGIELLGMLLLLRGTMGNTQGVLRQRGTSVFPTFEAVGSAGPGFTAALLAAAPILAYVAPPVKDWRGGFGSWLASAVFLLAGIAAVFPCLREGTRIRRQQSALALLCLVASAGAVAIRPERTIVVPLGGPPLSALGLFTLLLSLLLVGAWMTMSGRRIATGWPAAVMIVIGVLSVLVTGSRLQYWLLQLMALTAFHANRKSAAT